MNLHLRIIYLFRRAFVDADEPDIIEDNLIVDSPQFTYEAGVLERREILYNSFM